MPYATLSFSEFLNRHGNACRLVMGDDGLFAPSVRERQQAALLLNEACRWAWKFGGPLMLPCLTESASLTPTSGVLARADVQDSPRVSVWTASPEADYRIGGSLWRDYLRLAVPCAAGWTVIDATTATPLVVYYQKETAQFSGIAWATATSYAVGALVYQSGECYKCLTAHTSGTFATDLAASKWRVQNVPEEMTDALAAKIKEITAGDMEVRPAKAQEENNAATTLMEDMHVAYLYAKLQPWFLHNGGSKSP